MFRKAYLLLFNFISLINMHTLCCLVYCRFLVSLQIRNMTPSALFFISKNVLAVPGLLWFLMGFRISLLIFIYKKKT